MVPCSCLTDTAPVGSVWTSETAFEFIGEICADSLRDLRASAQKTIDGQRDRDRFEQV
jgi:hypothetical protein